MGELTRCAMELTSADEFQVSATFLNDNPLNQVYNGQSNPMVVTISNKGQNNYTIVGSSSSFHDPVKHWKLLKNGTTTKHKQALNAGDNFTVPYNVYSEFKPQDLGLTVWVDLKNGKESTRVTAYNQTISVQEPASSSFDVAGILAWVLFLLGVVGLLWLGSLVYFGKNEAKRNKRRGDAELRASERKQATTAPVVVKGGYEEEWIPTQHIKSRKGATSDDGTSGAESESKARRRKGRK